MQSEAVRRAGGIKPSIKSGGGSPYQTVVTVEVRVFSVLPQKLK